MPFFSSYGSVVIWVLSSAAILYIGIELIQKKWKVPIFTGMVESCKRPVEKNMVDWGAPLLAAGIVVSLLVFDYPETTCGVIHVCLCDAIAAFVGREWGKKKIFYTYNKTYVGSLAYFISASLACSLFIPFWMAVAVGFIGTILESIPMRHWDNFVIPVGVSFCASLLLWL